MSSPLSQLSIFVLWNIAAWYHSYPGNAVKIANMLYIIYFFWVLFERSQAARNVEEDIAAARGNQTILHTKIAPSWVLGSDVRGTADIVWSCFVTLTACIYTAIHLNVPPPHQGTWRLVRRQLRWGILALVAPEFVLYRASEQFEEARWLTKELNKLGDAKGKSVSHVVVKVPTTFKEH